MYSKPRWIPVLPKNYRRIVMHAIGAAAQPVVLADKKAVTDLSESGPLTQKGIRRLRDLEVRDGERPILGFHDHPDEMWISEDFAPIVEHCRAQGWLKVQRSAS